MKATMSRDGKLRANFRVDFRLSKDELISLLATHVTQYGEELVELSEKRVMELVKTQLRFSGTDSLELGSEAPETLVWAEEQVEKFWKD